MELNKKYPEKEPISKSDIFLILIWVIVGLAFSIWPAVLSITNLIWNSSEIESDISNLFEASLEYNEKLNKSEISTGQKDWIYRYQWSYYWGSEAYKYKFEYVNPEESNDEYKPLEDNEKLYLSTKEHERAWEFYDNKDRIYFDFKFEDWKLVNRRVYDPIIKKDLDELTVEEIKKEFDPELKYPIKEIEVNSDINISEYEENIIYKVTLPAWEREDIKIINDSDNAILLFEKDTTSISNEYYKGEIIKKRYNNWYWWGYSSKEETMYFYYKKPTTEEKIHYSETEKLSKEEFNKKIVVMAEDRFYNDYWKDLYATLIDDHYVWDDPYETKIVKDWGLLEIPDNINFIYITDHEPKQEEFPRYEEYDQYAQHYVQEGTEWTSWEVKEL